MVIKRNTAVNSGCFKGSDVKTTEQAIMKNLQQLMFAQYLCKRRSKVVNYKEKHDREAHILTFVMLAILLSLVACIKNDRPTDNALNSLTDKFN